MQLRKIRSVFIICQLAVSGARDQAVNKGDCFFVTGTVVRGLTCNIQANEIIVVIGNLSTFKNQDLVLSYGEERLVLQMECVLVLVL